MLRTKPQPLRREEVPRAPTAGQLLAHEGRESTPVTSNFGGGTRILNGAPNTTPLLPAPTGPGGPSILPRPDSSFISPSLGAGAMA